MHETFNMRQLENDIALLQLEGPAKLSSQVNTVCLPPSGNKVAAGTTCYITGNYWETCGITVIKYILFCVSSTRQNGHLAQWYPRVTHISSRLTQQFLAAICYTVPGIVRLINMCHISYQSLTLTRSKVICLPSVK